MIVSPIRCGALLVALLFAALPAAAQPLRLQQAIDAALLHNSDARLAELAVDAAAAASVSAGAAPNPVLTLQSTNINPHAGVGAGDWRSKTVDSSVRVDQLIERGGKRNLRRAGAAQLEAASHDDLDEARRQLRLQVSQAYYEALAAVGRGEIARDTARLFEQTVAAAQLRQRAGDLAQADVARAEVDALRARNDAVQAQADLQQARAALALLIGAEDNGATLELASDWPVLAAAEATPPDDALLERRADLRAAQHRVDAAEAARQLALAARSSDVTVGLQFEHYPTSVANPQGSGNSVGVILQVPLTLRYNYQGEIRSAAAALDVARENMVQLRRQARSTLQMDQVRLRAAAERLARYDQGLLAAAGKAAAAAEFAFQRGALGIMDLLDVRRVYRNTQLEALSARADYAKSLAAVQAAQLPSP